jgi:nucleoside-diphosphate-sugar epimerase
MRVLITGAAGMIGRKLTARLAATPVLAGQPITALDLHDIVLAEAMPAPGFETSVFAGELAQPGIAERLALRRPVI